MELDTVVGQGTALRPVLHWLSAKLQGKPVPAKCWAFLGEPGVGKTHSAKCLAKDLGAADDLSGLYEVTASELSIDKCRQLFDRDMRLHNMFGGKEKVLLIEELELLSPAAQVFLKVQLENLPKNVTVVATSNDVGRLQYALVERFHLRKFDSTGDFGVRFTAHIRAVWFARHNELPPAQHVVWGWEGTRFSARTALRDMETAENEMFV